MKLWIARDERGNNLFLYKSKPKLNGDIWESSEMYDIDNILFPEVTFENSPQQVEIKLI